VHIEHSGSEAFGGILSSYCQRNE